MVYGLRKFSMLAYLFSRPPIPRRPNGMSKPVPHFALTANRLADGAVVYVAAGPAWSEHFGDAVVTPDASTRDGLLSWAKTQESQVCGAYVLDVLVTPDGERRMSQRERLRAAGASQILTRLRLTPEDLSARTRGAR